MSSAMGRRYRSLLSFGHMSIPVPHSVAEIVGRRFLRRDQPDALALLAEYQCSDEALRERVLRGVVLLAGRDLGQLRDFLDCAREDYRNVILWQEHAEQSRNQFFGHDH